MVVLSKGDVSSTALIGEPPTVLGGISVKPSHGRGISSGLMVWEVDLRIPQARIPEEVQRDLGRLLTRHQLTEEAEGAIRVITVVTRGVVTATRTSTQRVLMDGHRRS